MSVEAYLKKVDAGAKAAIQKNAEYIASHPYPKDLLAEVVKPLGDKSVLNKIFGPSGRKKSLGSFFLFLSHTTTYIHKTEHNGTRVWHWT